MGKRLRPSRPTVFSLVALPAAVMACAPRATEIQGDGATPAALADSSSAPPSPDASGESAGCVHASGERGVLRKTLVVDGQVRGYLLSVPQAYRPRVATRLVFAWHGLGGSGARVRGSFGVEEAAAGQAIFIYPDALPLPAFGNLTGWDLSAAGPDLRLFDALLAQVSRTHCIDRARVYATGHSFGGYMSHALGCERGTLLRAIAPVAGGLPSGGCAGGAALAVWGAHGSNDNVVPFSAGEAARAHWKAAAGCSDTIAPAAVGPCVVHQGCGESTPVHWCVHDLGHRWPAFAGAAIWQFFSSLR